MRMHMYMHITQGWFSLIFGIVFTLLLALSEAFDIDVLIGILMMPFITVMRCMSSVYTHASATCSLASS